MLMESMFEPASATSEATLASTPRWFSTVTLIAAWKRRVMRALRRLPDVKKIARVRG